MGSRQLESYFKFGSIRNPWDRVVSLYERREGPQLRNQLAFEQFVDAITCATFSPAWSAALAKAHQARRVTVVETICGSG